jgi:hypothetical protein
LGDHWRSLKPTYQRVNNNYKSNFTRKLIKSSSSQTHSNKNKNKIKTYAHNIHNSIFIVDFENNKIAIKRGNLVAFKTSMLLGI